MTSSQEVRDRMAISGALAADLDDARRCEFTCTRVDGKPL